MSGKPEAEINQWGKAKGGGFRKNENPPQFPGDEDLPASTMFDASGRYRTTNKENTGTDYNRWPFFRKRGKEETGILGRTGFAPNVSGPEAGKFSGTAGDVHKPGFFG